MKPRTTKGVQVTRHSENEVIELDESNTAEVIDDHDLGEDEAPPLGDPFAVAVGCDLLRAAPGVPGCWACMRCDCGRAFKVDLLTEGRKPCPGCGVVYSHCLLVGPADDPQVTEEFLDYIEGEPEQDEDQPMGDEPAEVIDQHAEE